MKHEKTDPKDQKTSEQKRFFWRGVEIIFKDE
jgi:hypothetical protein